MGNGKEAKVMMIKGNYYPELVPKNIQIQGSIIYTGASPRM